MGRPQFFSPEGIARTTAEAEAEASISASRSQTARRISLHEEVERLLPQARSEVQQNQTSSTGNALARMRREPGAQPEPQLPSAGGFAELSRFLERPEESQEDGLLSSRPGRRPPSHTPSASTLSRHVQSSTGPESATTHWQRPQYAHASPSFGPARRLVEEDIPVDVLVHYFRSSARRCPRVRHLENGNSTLHLRTSQLRESLRATGYR
jgi:hypothetical protein